jgi:hypothetical protein
VPTHLMQHSLYFSHGIHLGHFSNYGIHWRAPKSLVKPKLGLSYLNNGIVGNSGHAPNF